MPLNTENWFWSQDESARLRAKLFMKKQNPFICEWISTPVKNSLIYNWKNSSFSQNWTTDNPVKQRYLNRFIFNSRKNRWKKKKTKLLIGFYRSIKSRERQLGLRRKRSIVEARTELNECIGPFLSNKDSLAGSMIQLLKAFDTVKYWFLV